MLELKTLVPKLDRLLVARRFGRPPEPKQRRMMIVALSLLLVALCVVLYHDRDFWFPETQEAQENDNPQPIAPAAVIATTTQTVAAKPVALARKKSHATKPQVHTIAPAAGSPANQSAPIIARTVLPPLEVEVVAGNVHRTLRSGASSVHVDLQPRAPAQEAFDIPASSAAVDTAASVTSNAAERVQMSDAENIVTSPVKPGYPLLARQMKVQGSVVLQALIGRDGLIQDLRVLSGPPILASAALQAVKQWHFKPHYQGADAVETQARITVNFTISTN